MKTVSKDLIVKNKIVITKVVGVSEQYAGFTCGKIYKFVNGQCFDDKKTLRPTGFKCKYLSFFGSTFIPLVE